MPENLQMQNLYSNMKYNLLQKKNTNYHHCAVHLIKGRISNLLKDENPNSEIPYTMSV
jgi:hypothetical protein